MPISPTSAGNDAVLAPISRPGGSAGGLTLDYGARDRGPFRQALMRAAAPAAVSVASNAPVQPTEAVYEGAQALAALQRDLLGGGAVMAQEAVPGEADTAVLPADPAAIDAAAEPPAPAAEPDMPSSWRDDEVKGRRLGDRPVARTEGGDGVETWLFGEDGFGFDDLIDVVNPLQHIPIVSSIYRWITGDEISPAASVAGGALFGGPIGLAGAVASVAIEEATGRDLGGHAMAMMFGDGAGPDGGSPAPGDATNLAALPAPALPSPDPAASDPAAIPEQRFFPLETAPVAAAPPAVPSPDAFPAESAETSGIPLPPSGAAPILFIPANDALSAIPAAGAPAAGTPDAPPSPADAAIAAQMMLALDKYEALSRQRNTAAGTLPATGPAAGGLYDSRF
jgi:hypothetical protein